MSTVVALGTSRRRAATARPRPPRAPGGANAVLGTLVFLACEAMFFAGLVSAFLVLRAGVPDWPPPGQPRFPLFMTTLNTLVLLASGHTIGRARRAGEAPETGRWLGVTAILGALFVTVQGIEWVRLVEHGLAIRPGIYGGLFSMLIGCHGVHVVGGVAVLGAVWRRARPDGPALRPDTLRAVELYWRFVVGVWLIIFGLVYLW